LPKQQPIKKTINELRAEIRRHDELYYVQDDPEISDREYDELMERLRQLEQKSPELIVPDSPTQRVAGRPAEGVPEFINRRPMLSHDKI
jgi:DNA ligase (NAD+)